MKLWSSAAVDHDYDGYSNDDGNDDDDDGGVCDDDNDDDDVLTMIALIRVTVVLDFCVQALRKLLDATTAGVVGVRTTTKFELVVTDAYKK